MYITYIHGSRMYITYIHGSRMYITQINHKYRTLYVVAKIQGEVKCYCCFLKILKSTIQVKGNRLTICLNISQ